MKGKSKSKFTPEFKLEVVLEVLKERETLAVISKRHELHPNQISDWEKQFTNAASTLFKTAHKPTLVSAEPDVALLYEQIERLQMELTALADRFFKKSCPNEPGPTRSAVVVVRWLIQPPQVVCASSASGLCTYSLTTVSPWRLTPEDLLLMRLLDEQYLLTPYYGYRKM